MEVTRSVSVTAPTTSTGPLKTLNSYWKKVTSSIMRHQKIFVTVILVLALICLLYYHARSTKTAGHVQSASGSSSSHQFHKDYPNSRIEVQVEEKMMRLPDSEQNGCRQQCEDTDWCHFWEHNQANDECLLYKAITQGSNYEAAIEPYQGSHVGVFERRLKE